MIGRSAQTAGIEIGIALWKKELLFDQTPISGGIFGQSFQGCRKLAGLTGFCSSQALEPTAAARLLKKDLRA
jgi:hypothetical protein